MLKSFLEMGFSVQGIHPKGCDGVYTNREGFLFKKIGDTFKPMRPEIGNRYAIGSRGAYFYFQANGKTYKVFQDEIEEFGLDAKAHIASKGG